MVAIHSANLASSKLIPKQSANKLIRNGFILAMASTVLYTFLFDMIVDLSK